MVGGLWVVDGNVFPAGQPMIIGAIAVISSGIFNSVFHSGKFKAETAKPIGARSKTKCKGREH